VCSAVDVWGYSLFLAWIIALVMRGKPARFSRVVLLLVAVTQWMVVQYILTSTKIFTGTKGAK
jgi:hypothetical protein